MKLTPEQIEAIAQAYCRLRYEQDGTIFLWREKTEMVEILGNWYCAFESVLNPAKQTPERNQ